MEPAPKTIEELLDFARESLGLTDPVADRVYRKAFGLLIQGVNFAKVVGKAVIGGVAYYYCGGNFYRAEFQGNQLVYVTAKPE